MRTVYYLLSTVYCLLSTIPCAADWPQWRGGNRDGLSKETDLLKSWPKDGPPLLWTFADTGVGYSSPSIVGNRLFITGARGDTEFLFALDVETGKEAWSAKLGPTFTFKGNEWGDGPRAAPTISGDSVFALGGQGDLVRFGAETGKERWRVSLVKDLLGEVSPQGGNTWGTGWGFTAAPLVDGNHVICAPGGKSGLLAALDKDTGKVIWRSNELIEAATYSSPMVAEIAGIRQYIQMTDKGVAGVAANDGRLLWHYLKKPSYQDVVIPTPIVKDSYVYVTSGYGAGCDLIRLAKNGDRFKAEKVYANKEMVNQQGGVVLIGDHLYGYSENKGWLCQDFKTGKRLWAERRKHGRGSVVYADGQLYCYSEDDGKIALVEADAKGWKEKSRFEIPQKSKMAKPSARIWTHPVIANGRLYLRDQELLFCYDIRGPK